MNPTLAWGQADSEDPAADSGEARKKALELFRESEAAYQDGRFNEAARLLEQAYTMHKEPVLLYNLARAYEGMGELEKAVTAYQGYIEGSPEARDRGAITRRIETLEKQLADQKKLAAEKQKLAAERARRQDPPDPPPGEPDREQTGPGIWPWLTAGAGVALLGSGAVVGVLSQSKRDDADADPSHASARETFRDAESLATTANVLFIVGGLVTAGGVTWILISTPSSAEQSAVGLGVGPGSLRLQGRW